jgi:hypothetical protein
MHVRRLLAGLMVGLLALSVAAGVEVGPAVAAPTYATVEGIDFAPVETQFNEATETLTAVVEVDVPGDWAFVSGDLQLYRNSVRVSDWLQPVSQERIGQVHKITFRGQVPNTYGGLNRGYLRVDPVIYYRDTLNTLRMASYSYSWYHSLVGDTRATIDGPSRITSGSALRLTGRATCYTSGTYVPPPTADSWYGWVNLQYREPGSTGWTDSGGGESLNAAGEWAHTFLAVGATLEWRAVVYVNGNCATANSAVLRVEAGSGEPPPPPTLPGAPGLTVGNVTRSTVALDWSTASGSGITGYRFGWESASGQPQPSWSNVYPVGSGIDDPFVMTNLCAGCTYTMWVEAVTSNGAGDRATVTVTTDAGAPPPPPPVVRAPSVVRSVTAGARNHAAVIRWRAPSRGPVDKYQVHRTGRNYTVADSARRSLTVRGLVNGRLYRFTVRAHNPAGWGPWSAVARVRPHR